MHGKPSHLILPPTPKFLHPKIINCKSQQRLSKTKHLRQIIGIIPCQTIANLQPAKVLQIPPPNKVFATPTFQRSRELLTTSPPMRCSGSLMCNSPLTICKNGGACKQAHASRMRKWIAVNKTELDTVDTPACKGY